ncbi:Histone deacetylase HDT2 [Platanthera guangdongensis]|uniref:Histone deacetylase HDT2 n=1 Tax=Platanthera guangdongensis TaxID=2320717 RepID=A0ABR2MFW3_9ASPA
MQASLGVNKKEKGSETVQVFVKVNDQKLVIGTLSVGKYAQIQYDLVFEKDFELSHGSKKLSSYIHGESAPDPLIKNISDYNTDTQRSSTDRH